MTDTPEEATRTDDDQKKIEILKNITGLVYLCQVLAFALAGVPLLVGVAINFLKRRDVTGTWLESHFNWQINTFWLACLLFAVAGFTATLGIAPIVVTIAVLVLGYRIALGWFALNANKPIRETAFKTGG